MFAPAIGRVAERLGRGLQNLVQQFESARDLNESPFFNSVEAGVFLFEGVMLAWTNEKRKKPGKANGFKGLSL